MPPPDHPGLAAIRRALSDVEFPTTKRRLLESAGEWEVAFPGHRDYRLRRFVERVPRYKFEDREAVVEELRRAWWWIAPEDDETRP
ncbi:MAG TPA: hypothetical protein VI997_10945 [Candidatus Thermoplasmatota archaeon]|nr:hypothetical protein [Candidatus Thermoplasmatota archaeon]